MPKRRIPLKIRFNKYFRRGKKNECWPWHGDLDKDGYGRILIFKSNKPQTHENGSAHRVSFEIFKGKIPKGLWVLHTCDNRKCVNPNHLYLGTIKDNMRDCVNRKRHAYGIYSGNAKLTNKDIKAIHADTRYQYVIASDYGVIQATISKIKLRKTWQHIT